MKSKPKGAKHRNLTVRGGVIYYQRRECGKRIRFSCKTNDWEEAAGVARLYEERKGLGRLPFAAIEAPRLAEFAERYLEEDTAHLAPTTLSDRRGYLAPDGRLLAGLGARRLSEIGVRELREWWNAEDFGRPGKRAVVTGRNYLDVLSGIFVYARELDLAETNPVDEFRKTLRRRTRTQRGRASSDAGRDLSPIDQPAEIEKLVTYARTEGLEAYVYTLLGLDAGLRRGEALGLRWGAIVWGRDDDDPARALLVSESRSRGGAPGPTKSGRSRCVALSTRLRGGLLGLRRLRERPPADEAVLRSGFHRREWARIIDHAEIGRRRFKDLRDTFGSQLVSAGVPLAYVSRQLGHVDVATTARHYARWCGGDEYREPVRLLPGEIPADLLARLAVASDPTRDPTHTAAERPVSVTSRPH